MKAVLCFLSTANRQLSTVNYQLSIINYQLIMRMWGAMGAPPVAEEATRASGCGRQATKPFQRQGECRVPQQEELADTTQFLRCSEYKNFINADVVELVDSVDLGSSGIAVQVRVLSSAPKILVLRNEDFLSIAKQWYIITARRVVHIISPKGAVYHHALACIQTSQ